MSAEVKLLNNKRRLIVATLFYIVLCVFSDEVHFDLVWFIVSLFFEGGTQVIQRYR